MGKGKLHELLAVETDLDGQAKLVMKETHKTFSDKQTVFQGKLRTYKPFVDDGIEYPESRLELASTVDQKLAYTNKAVIKYYDAILQKEATNQTAKADLVVDGEVIATDLPATFLLGMESRLRILREMYAKIPTLPLGVVWEKADSRGEGVFVTKHPEESFKTKKTIMHKVLYEATKEHRAEIDKWDETENVGKYSTTQWSGMLTAARKSELLGKIDTLIGAVKKARQRANNTEVVKINVGRKIIDFIHN